MRTKDGIRAESILIIEDQPLYIEQVLSILKKRDKLINISTAYSAEAGERLLESNTFDIILLDINLPDKSGIDFLAELRKKNNMIPVILLSQYSEDELDWIAKKYGAIGFINKAVDSSQFISRYESILYGDAPLSRNNQASKANRFSLLRNREKQILELVCKQFSSKQIADQLCLSLHTVKNHRKAINRKTGSSNVAGLITWAIRNNIIISNSFQKSESARDLKPNA